MKILSVKGCSRICASQNPQLVRLSTTAAAAPKKTETVQDKNLVVAAKALQEAEELSTKYHKVIIF